MMWLTFYVQRHALGIHRQLLVAPRMVVAVLRCRQCQGAMNDPTHKPLGHLWGWEQSFPSRISSMEVANATLFFWYQERA
jgi:hypothetical protein